MSILSPLSYVFLNYTTITVNIQFSKFKIVARRVELRQTKPCQCISNLQILLCKEFSVSDNTTTIHTSPIDLNYCSSARLSGDKEIDMAWICTMHDQRASRHLGCRFQRIILRQQRLPIPPHINSHAICACETSHFYNDFNL